jgi:hypothetical protein
VILELSTRRDMFSAMACKVRELHPNRNWPEIVKVVMEEIVDEEESVSEPNIMVGNHPDHIQPHKVNFDGLQKAASVLTKGLAAKMNAKKSQANFDGTHTVQK